MKKEKKMNADLNYAELLDKELSVPNPIKKQPLKISKQGSDESKSLPKRRNLPIAAIDHNKHK